MKTKKYTIEMFVYKIKIIIILLTRISEFSCYVLLSLLVIGSFAANIPENKNQNNQNDGENFFGIGKKWVVLVAGSYGWNNYRHQVSLRIRFKSLF